MICDDVIIRAITLSPKFLSTVFELHIQEITYVQKKFVEAFRVRQIKTMTFFAKTAKQ